MDINRCFATSLPHGELVAALGKMKAGKAKDGAGIVPEMLKHGDHSLHDTILELFNNILVQGRVPPTSWRLTRLKVIFKKGDPKLAKKYRPIAILPILYRLFSRMLCHRIQDSILAAQSLTRQHTDQATPQKITFSL